MSEEPVPARFRPWPPRARVSRLGPAFDLLAAYQTDGVFFERAGLGVAGSGLWSVSMAFGGRQGGPVPSLQDLIGSIEVEAVEAGAPPPLLVGSIPFDTRRTGVFGVPARVVRRDSDGVTWSIESDRGAAPWSRERFVGRAAPHAPFSGMQLRPEPPPDAYERAVADAVVRIRAGELSKVVLARTLEVAAGRAFDPKQLVARLRAVEPGCFTFAVPTGPGLVLVGASPELLVSRMGRAVTANPLAGSAPRFGDPGRDAASADRLLESVKDGQEHRIVVEAVAATLAPLCEDLRWDPEPVLLETANVWHLSTRFQGTLLDPAPSVLRLVQLLHPTPAVCGEPRERAMELIRELEPVPRASYAGAVGWMDAYGDGTWAIALRCAELRGDIARLYAGAGIVAGSDPAQELEETDRKFRAFLDALRWG